MKIESGFSLAMGSQPFRIIAFVLFLRMSFLSVLLITLFPIMQTTVDYFILLVHFVTPTLCKAGIIAYHISQEVFGPSDQRICFTGGATHAPGAGDAKPICVLPGGRWAETQFPRVSNLHSAQTI